jgi:Mrp family chromosome partitioning ATPase
MSERTLSQHETPHEGQSGQAPSPFSSLAHVVTPTSARTFYEAYAFDTLRTLWRGKWILAACVGAGTTLALLALSLSGNSYTANAVVRFDFARNEADRQSAPSANLDAAVLIEGEAQAIRSSAMARRVVLGLKLDKDPAYTRIGLIRSLFTSSDSRTANIDTAARRLMNQLSVTNNNRSYTITVSGSAGDPEWAATIANAFLQAYARSRTLQRLRETEATARSALAKASAAYGELHPALIQARTNMAAVEESVRQELAAQAEITENMPAVSGLTFVRAEPEWLPTGPNPMAYFLVGLIGSLLAGVTFLLLRERRDTGFRTESGVAAAVGVRCVGMIPRTHDKFSDDRRLERREALRSLCLSAGLFDLSASGKLAGKNRNSRVVMISSALPAAGKHDFVGELNRSLEEEGSRILIIDAAPSSHSGDAIGLDDALDCSDTVRAFFVDESDKPTSQLRRKAGLNGARNPFASVANTGRAFERLLDEAKSHYDVIIIDAPPVLLFADSVFLARFADVLLLVADWNKSPRSTVAEAVHRFRDNRQNVDGIVLTDVDLGSYSSFATGDRTYYLSRFQDAFRSPD